MPQAAAATVPTSSAACRRAAAAARARARARHSNPNSQRSQLRRARARRNLFRASDSVSLTAVLGLCKVLLQVKDDIKPDSDISAHWTRRLNPTDPAYETHVENVFGQRRVRELETDTKSKKIHALTAQEGFEGAIKLLCLFIKGQQPDHNKA